MYAPPHHMNLPKQQIVRRAAADEEDGDGTSSAAACGTGDSIEHAHMGYEAQALDDSATAGMGGVIESIPPDAVYATGSGSDMVIADGEDSSQLTLSFRGQVYVFDAVTPKKVHAVLLLLGGCELSSGSQGVELSQDSNHRGALDFPTRCSQPQRAASLNRFRQKRKERCFDKKVRYSVRQEVAMRMQRNKGQFTSAKRPDGSMGWGSGNDSGQEDNPQETSCTHCGTSSKCTPMMRRGPSGPRSLCNACGLFWANRGTLRDLSKRNPESSLTPSEQQQGMNETNGSVHGTGKDLHGSSMAHFSNGDEQGLIAEQ